MMTRKFKVGDRIRRIRHHYSWAPLGFETVVTQEGWYMSKNGYANHLVDDQWELIMDTPKLKFEVGKVYHLNIPNWTILYTCVFVGETRSIFIHSGERSQSEPNVCRPDYVEYVEPKVVTTWVNVYPSGQGGAFRTRTEADKCASPDRMACIKVVATEGTYHDA